MDGENLYEGSIEGSFELWIERTAVLVDTNGDSTVIMESILRIIVPEM